MAKAAAKATAQEKKAEKARKLRAQAAALDNKDKFDRIVSTLKKHPEHYQAVIDCLQNLGAQVPDQAADEGPITQGSSQAPDGDSPKADADAIPRTETTVGRLKVDRLAEILTSLEPAAWSVRNLNALKEHHKKKIPKDSLLQLLEFDTGVGASTYIGAEGPLKSQGTLVSRLRALSVHRGRRGRELPLPPNWPNDGVYKVVVKSGKVHLRRKFAQHDPEDKELPAYFANLVRDAASLMVGQNYSETDAVLSEPAGSVKYVCCHSFPQELTRDPLQHSNVAKAICDGKVDDSPVKSAASPADGGEGALAEAASEERTPKKAKVAARESEASLRMPKDGEMESDEE